MPPDQHIQSGHGECESYVEIRPHAVHHLLAMADHGQHRQYGLNKYTILPFPPSTQFEVGEIAVRGMEGCIAQNNHALFKSPCKVLSGTFPRYNQPLLV